MGLVSPLLQLDGAVADTGADLGVAAHYGEPLAEQRAWARGQGWADLSHLDVVRVAGPERLEWLHSLLSAKLDDLAPGQSREALLLDPAGHIEQAMAVSDDGQAAWLITDTGRGAGLAGWLDSMRFAKRVEVAQVTSTWAVLGLSRPPGGVGNGKIAALHGAWGPVWQDPWPGVTEGGTSYAPSEGHPGTQWHLSLALVPRDDLAQSAQGLLEAGVRPVGTWALTALRVAAWRPRVGAEVDGVALPHELDWLRTAVHLHKGCYRGQETIAKVINVGKPPRRLVMLHLDGLSHELPAPGDPVALAQDGSAVGHLTSVGLHYEDGPIALALIKRNVDAGALLRTGDAAAAQVAVVPVSGESAARPAIDRPRGLGFATRRGPGRG